MVGTRPNGFVWERKGALMLITILSKGPLLATLTDPFNSAIYNQPFFTKRTAASKIPHLLCEKTYL